MRISSMIAVSLLTTMIGQGAAWADIGHKRFSFGEPGKASEVTRTVEVIADDRNGLVFKMNTGPIRQGETIKFVVSNQGSGEHEFSVGDTASQRAHANLMKRNPDMKHEGDPSAVTLQPGETKTLIWKFTKPVQGEIVFACQIPGHYEAGMVHKAMLDKGKAPAKS